VRAAPRKRSTDEFRCTGVRAGHCAGSRAERLETSDVVWRQEASDCRPAALSEAA
jgi:hypothetical protein